MTIREIMQRMFKKDDGDEVYIYELDEEGIEVYH